ncbi:hypothetical protein [Roseovarius aestuarii]|uniref:Periplasmic protein-like protein n=1 Tax=Roseovarius aestuarii TaxID=475083 RepID=A0A1X7BZR4_9RHOB|nr:hypothetical protein [Roseovarius aestuarii]SMC14769.1 hypothetical protein ROA7745_04639 [Roseovarius aestuarii]
MTRCTSFSEPVALLFAAFCAMPALAMTFELAGTDHRRDDAAWIQAEGPITSSTVDDFIAFIDAGPDWWPRRIRFNSSGGNLAKGVELGRELRRRGFATEVGSHEVDPEWIGTGHWTFTRRISGKCASACAYAFMGGIERRLEPGSAIGVHQFYSAGRMISDGAPDLVLVEQGSEQEASAVLLSYVLEMGVDGRVFAKAGLSGPDEMSWIGAGDEAIQTGLSYSPTSWSAWKIDIYGDGVLATSERQDKKYRMSAYCTERDGAFFDIYVSDKRSSDGSWSLKSWIADQCIPMGDAVSGTGARLVIGNRVTMADTAIFDHDDGFFVSFALGRNPQVGNDPSFMNKNDYGACTTERFIGTPERIVPAITAAFESCVR